MNQRALILVLVGLVIAAAVILVTVGPFSPGGGDRGSGGLAWDRPPVVLISLDTLRADHLSVYGYELPTSPSLDLFAGQAVRFEHALCQSAGTLPSHLSLLTSLYPPQFRITRPDGHNDTQPETRLRLSDAVVTLAEALAASGYDTAAFTDGGMVASRYGFDQGFAVYDDEVTDEGHLRSGLRYRIPRIERFLAARDRAGESSRPLFLFVHTYDIHSPYRAPEPFDRSFSKKSFDELEQELGYPLGLGTLNKHRRELTKHQVDTVQGLYDNGILATDDQMARLFELLELNGLYSDAIVIVLSDHGEEFMDHGRFNHGKTVYEELVEVPLMIRLPGGREGGRLVAEAVALVDVAPTVLELVGAAPAESFQGESLVPSMLGRRPGRDDGSGLDRRFFFDIPNTTPGLQGMRKGSMKVIQHLDSGRLELYDLGQDPEELDDLARRSPEECDRLSRELTLWVAEMEREGARRGWLSGPGRGGLSEAQRKRLEALGYVD